LKIPKEKQCELPTRVFVPVKLNQKYYLTFVVNPAKNIAGTFTSSRVSIGASGLGLN
jgi:hypothetical protein